MGKMRKNFTKYSSIAFAGVVGLLSASSVGAEAVTSDGTTAAGLFGDMLNLAVDVLPWFVVIILINALINKVK